MNLVWVIVIMLSEFQLSFEGIKQKTHSLEAKNQKTIFNFIIDLFDSFMQK